MQVMRMVYTYNIRIRKLKKNVPPNIYTSYNFDYKEYKQLH